MFHILQCFVTKLHNFAKFGMLFQAVLMNIPNSKVCLRGEWSIWDSFYKEKFNLQVNYFTELFGYEIWTAKLKQNIFLVSIIPYL